jgi:non-specific serine/threonine protein kinase
LQAGAAGQRHFLDGAVFIDLSTTTLPRLVVPTIAQSLGLRERAEQDRRDQLCAFLSGRRLLLVLDNFEQVLTAASEVARILAAAPGVSVLVTSRAPLRIGGERELPIPPLSTAISSATPDALLASDAGRLFVERVQEHDPGFVVDDESAPVIADICAWLDGLPLAIELAAARCKLLPPRYLRDRLEHRLPLLTHGARDAPARQRAMRDAIAWSYGLLSPEEQRLFRRLAMCAGGGTLEVAAAVFHDDEDAPDRGESSTELLDLVGSLVDQSLLVSERGPDGEPRFRMLETIREYGLERLEPGEETVARSAHARYFLRFAQSLSPLLMTRAAREPFDRLIADEANVRAAASWFSDLDDAASLASIVAACYPVWYVTGHLREVERWLQRALAGRERAQPADRAHLLIGRAEIHMVRGETERANTRFAAGLSVLRGANGEFDFALALISYGASLNYGGNYAEGEELLGQALALADAVTDPRLRAAIAGRALGNLSDSARGLGDLDLAAARGEDALRRLDGHHLELAGTRIVLDLGHIARDQGNLRVAIERYLSCIARVGERGEVRLIADSLAGIASVAAVWDQRHAALLLFGAADALRERGGIGMNLPVDTDHAAGDLAALLETVGSKQAAATLEAGRALSLAAAAEVATTIQPPESSPDATSSGDHRALTRREREVLQLMAEWRTDREIAAALFLSTRTASWHVRSILAKLGAASRREAIAQAQIEGLLPP